MYCINLIQLKMGMCDSLNKKTVDSAEYFGVAKTFKKEDIINYENSNKVKLEFYIENTLQSHKYQVLVEFLNSDIKPFYTEEILSKGGLASFSTCYICDYFFEKPQLMRISLLRNRLNIGSITPYLGMILGSRNSTFKTTISPDKKEIINISGQGIDNFNTLLLVDFIIRTNRKVNFDNIDNKISFFITNNGRKVYSSESISSIGEFKTIKIPIALLQPQFEISFLNCRQKKIVTKSETIESFTQLNNRIYLSLNINKNEYNFYNRSQILQQYSFFDYIKNGVQLGLSIGIDFTSSNGQINNPNSLHALIPGRYNDYEQAIRTCGLILAFYDYDQLFPVYGFGAIVNNNPQVNMCFNINFKPNPEIYTIDNVINEYHNCLKKIILAGPTQFCPMIRREIELIKQENNPLNYHILMILTDGVIVDQALTIDAIVEASFLPFSLIIIGIGNDHFREMIELDGDRRPLVSSNGIRRMRDVVQFVPFNKYRNNPNELASEVLAEIPNQVVEYYSMRNIFPNTLSNALLRCDTMMNNYNVNNF